MTRRVDTRLTQELVERFRPESLARHARAVVLLLTVGDDGWPHVAMLSHFEIVAVDRDNLRVATYADSRTTTNLGRTGRVTLVVVDAGMVYYLKGNAEGVRRRMETAPHNTLTNVRIEEILEDHADTAREGATTITGGITYDGPEIAARVAGAGPIFEEMLA